MSSKVLRPWTDVVKLHPDVESGLLTEAIFAIDLGAIAAGDPNVPAVYRDAEAFFRATYLTVDLRKLLEEVLAALSGKAGYNRVLKLRTPFGGGKSHTLATLFHAARSRQALNVISEAKGFANPSEVAVAVFDGEKFDARDGKTLENGQVIRTMWGWIAWQIDPKKAFPLVEGHDRDRVAPGGDVIREVLTNGANGRPVLVLLDEVLKYMERAAAVQVLDSTLQRQAKDFFQNLTVEVAGSKSAALVYALTWSSREALGNMALLAEIDKLAARVDQLREPVSGDEILPVLQRRLLGAAPSEAVATEVATAYQEVVTGMQRAHAETPSARQRAEEAGVALRDRIRSAYPFHPALIDLMRERWTALDAFQRTRGALRFLASCLSAAKKQRSAHALLGPGDVLLGDVDVRVKMLKELGAQNDYDPVIAADIEGPNARAKRIDERLARETPALSNIKPATRLATAILLYSFGGLRRNGVAEGETLPPGVTESELLAACVDPDFDAITATAVLSELRTSCLYLHYDGARYCFKKDPNVTKLIEDAEQEISREEVQAKGTGPVRSRIRELLDRRLAGHRAAVIWPGKSQDLPDEEPRFLLGYLPLEFAQAAALEQEELGKELLTKYGDRPRRYRNGIGLAVPDKRQLEALRRAARYLLAIERVETKRQQLRLTRDQLDQLKERRQTEEAAAESAFRSLYSAIWLPRIEGGAVGLDKVEIGGRPLQATGIHERVMELLITVAGKVHTSVTPRKILELMKLSESSDGKARAGVPVRDVVDAFYGSLGFTRLDSALAIQKGITRGIAEGLLGYTSGAPPALGPDGRFQVSRDHLALGRVLADDEIDLESGFVMLPSAAPAATDAVPATTVSPSAGIQTEPADTSSSGSVTSVATQLHRVVKLVFKATRDQIFKTFPAIANLADKADGGRVTIHVEASSEKGFDPNWLRNAVEEPLDEADVEQQTPE